VTKKVVARQLGAWFDARRMLLVVAGARTPMSSTISRISNLLDAHSRGRRAVPARPARVIAVLLVALGSLATVAAVVPDDVTAQTSDDAARQAAREIQAARDRANLAAAAYFQAQSDLEVLEDEVVGMQRRADELERRVDELRRDVQSLAVARFATSGAQGIPLLTGLQAPKDQVQADVLVDVVTNVGSSSIDEFEDAQQELEEQRDELADQLEAIEDQQTLFSELQDEAEAEVQRLREIEEQRLTDEAVLQALAEQQAANLAKLVEVERRTAEAAARAQPNPGIAAAQEAIAAAAAAAADPNADPNADPGAQAGVVDDAAAPGMPRTSRASGGTSGGRTGTGGAGSVPIGIVNGTTYIDAIVCPMNGSAYGDSWGAPRSGGRSHEGVDMLAPMGTPIYAVVGGSVNFKQNRLGGNAASLSGDNGNRYYYAHLAGYEGVSRRVEQGEVIGYNGDTGNATGTPHLHFEVHPGGGLAVNPTPSVRAAGC
jgi:murein DD-endopeptidase MepM/ murein hydrolase activator NlpD